MTTFKYSAEDLASVLDMNLTPRERTEKRLSSVMDKLQKSKQIKRKQPYSNEELLTPEQSEPDLLTGFLNDRQREAAYAMQELTGPESVLPEISLGGEGTPLPRMTLNPRSSPAMQVGAGRAFSSLPFSPNPEEIPAFQEATRKVTDDYGDLASVALGLGSSLAPDIATNMGASAVSGALKMAAKGVPSTLRGLAAMVGKTGATNVGQNVLLAGSQAPEGQRLDAMVETATDPRTLAASFLPDALGATGLAYKQKVGAARAMQAVTDPDAPLMTAPDLPLPTEPEMPFTPGLPPEGDVFSPAQAAQRQGYIEGEVSKAAEARKPSLEKQIAKEARIDAMASRVDENLAKEEAVARTPSKTPGERPALKQDLPSRADTLPEGYEDVQKRRRAGPGAASTDDPGFTGYKQAETDPDTVDTPTAPPPPKLPPPEVKDAFAESLDVQEAVQLQQRIWQQQRSGAERVKNLLIQEEFRSDNVAGAAAIRGLKGAQAVREITSQRVYHQARKEFNQLDLEGKKLVKRFINQQKSPEDIGKRLGERIPVEALPPTWSKLWAESMKELEQKRDYLIKRGRFSIPQVEEMLRMKKEGVEWLTRDYARFLAGKAYKVNKGLHTRAIQWMQKHKGLTPVQAAHAIDELIGTWDSTTSLDQRWQQYQQNTGILKKREQIPSIIRDLLGEIKDPAFVLAASMGEMDLLYHQAKIGEVYTAPEYKGVVWNDQPDLKMRPVPNDPRQFGEFAGKFVEPALHEHLMYARAPQLANIVSDVTGFVLGPFRTAKIGLNHRAFLNNWFGNFMFSAGAGLPPWHPMWGPRYVQAAKALHAFGQATTAPAGAPKVKGMFQPSTAEAQWVQWAYEDRALVNGVGEDFGGNALKAIARDLAAAETKGVAGALYKTWAKIGKVTSHIGQYYDALDKHHRLAVYIEQVTQGVDRLKLPERQARARAAAIVNANFPSSASTGRGVRALGNASAFLNPIGLGFHADQLRVAAGWMFNAGPKQVWETLRGRQASNPVPGVGVQRLFSGQGAVQAFNVATFIGLLGAAGTVLRMRNGITDEEHKDTLKRLKPSYDRYTGLHDFWGTRDAKGRYEVLNFGNLVPLGMFLKGDRRRNILSRIAGNVVGGFAGPLTEDTFGQQLSDLGLGDQPMPPRPQLPKAWYEAAGEKAWNIMQPGTVENIVNVGRRAELWGHMEKTEEPLTLPQAALKVLSPVVAEPVGSRSSLGAVKQLKAEKKQQNAVKGEVKRQFKSGKISKEERREMLRQVKQKKQEIKKRRP